MAVKYISINCLIMYERITDLKNSSYIYLSFHYLFQCHLVYLSSLYIIYLFSSQPEGKVNTRLGCGGSLGLWFGKKGKCQLGKYLIYIMETRNVIYI